MSVWLEWVIVAILFAYVCIMFLVVDGYPLEREKAKKYLKTLTYGNVLLSCIVLLYMLIF